MPQSTFVNAGAGNAVASGSGANLLLSFPTSIVGGNILIMQVATRQGSVTINTPSGWTQIAQDLGGSTYHTLFYKIATGSESGSVTVSFALDSFNVAIGRIYQFTNTDNNAIYEASALGSTTSTTFSPPSITTSRPGGLALLFTMLIDAVSVAAVTGNSGGTWVEAVAEFSTTIGSDATIQLQYAALTNAGTISGGSASDGGASGQICRGLALLGTRSGGFQIIN